MIDNDEIKKFRKEKLPMYIGIVIKSKTAEDLDNMQREKRQLINQIKVLNKEYENESKKLYQAFNLNRKLHIDQLDKVENEIKKLKRILEKEKGDLITL